MKRKGCLICRGFMWQSLSQPRKSFVLFLTVSIPSQWQIGCTGPGKSVDEHTIAVPVLSPAAFPQGSGSYPAESECC